MNRPAVPGMQGALTGFGRIVLPGRDSIAWPLSAITLALLFQLDIAASRAINWDEFWHYSLVHRMLAGTLHDPIQTLFTRAFTWIASMPGSGIDHILTIRLFMFACLAVTAGCIAALAERFVPRPVSLLAALLYLTAGYVMRHGSSFRFDPMAAALLMGSLALLLRTNLRWPALLATAVLAALSALLTIKTVLYAPAFCGIAWLRWCEGGRSMRMLVRLGALAVTTVALFGLFFLLHSASLGPAANASAEFTLSDSANRMFSLGGLPYYRVVPLAAMLAPVFALCVLAMPFMLLKTDAGAERVALFALWLPITTLGFYYNTAPYFYVFILAPVAVACSPALAWLAKRYGTAAIAATLALNGVVVWLAEDNDVLPRQRVMLAAADTIFPQPVEYFDHSAVLGHFPKANSFLTAWGKAKYLAGHEPSMRDTMQRKTVPLVVENDQNFTRILRGRSDPDFLPGDAAALQENYVPFWGQYWVAGRSLAAGEERTSEFLVPGPYTVELGSLVVDGRDLSAGDVVKISRGTHRLRAGAEGPARLVWGTHTQRPDFAPPAGPFWASF